jgi:cysteinyl-tRNA synthetase
MKLYNSLTRKKEEFKPLASLAVIAPQLSNPLKEKQAGIYTCGPTVYNVAHIGNLRSFIFADVLQQTLKFNNYQVNWVMNITDIDDKTIRDSRIKYPEIKPMEALLKFTKEYEKLFWEDLKKLNIEKPDKTPHATEFIPQMQKLIIKILEAGYGYEKDGSFYFNIRKYSKEFKYGNLIELNLSQLKSAKRIQADEYEKEEIQDFVLWKTAKNNEPSWDFSYQEKNYPGRPGWHIECSAMSHEYLGIPFDIHTGGVDLKFPHHENEIAQSAAGYGEKKLANFFLHNEHILVDNEKMSKSKKNFYTIEDVKNKGFNPLSFRYFVLNAHYRSKLNFTWQGLKAAQNALNNLYSEYQNLIEKNPPSPPFEKGGLKDDSKKYRQQFLNALNNDLNTPQALAIMWEMIKDENLSAGEKKNLLLEFDKIFGLGLTDLKPVEIPENIKKLAEQREQLRQEKKWDEADEIRKKIEDLGFKIEDTDNGFAVKKL